VLGHIGINVSDLTAAKAYYDELMPLLGFEPFLSAEDEFAYRPADTKRGTFLFVYPAVEAADYSRHRPGLQQLAFMVPTRTGVWMAYDRAKALGGTVLNEPKVFPQYPHPYFATFWLDPFGFMLEAVCHHDRE
jgi:catechol 2,3-dioxygenase-like lactoylglutathione lyase family enzyme